jgi:acyl carrier protein
MNTTQIRENINKIIESVLKIDKNLIKETDSPETISEWNSLSHVILIDKIEKLFLISFNFDELIEIETVLDLYNITEYKLK